MAQSVNVTITNTDTIAWNATGTDSVVLGAHFATTAGTCCTWLTDQRFTLPSDVPAGAVTMSIRVRAPSGTSATVLELQLVKGSTWFAQRLSTAVTVGIPVAVWSADYSVTPPASWSVNETRALNVVVTNTGNQIWPAGGANPVHLGVHFADQAGTCCTWPTDQRFNLPNDILPGDSVTIPAAVIAPSTAGSYVLEFQMVKEYQFLFDQRVGTTVTVS